MSVVDSTMSRTKALPAAGASANFDSVDLGADRVGHLGERLTIHVKIPALPALVEDKTVIHKLQDSADDSTFADVLELSGATVTGASGDGAAAKEFRFFFPPDTRRYVRLVSTVLASGGDNTGVSTTLEFRV